MTWCWIIPVIVGLISALLGYLLGRAGQQRIINDWRTRYEAANQEVTAIGRKVTLLENDLDKARQSESKAKQSYNELIGRFDLLQREWDKNRTDIQNLKEENAELQQRLSALTQTDSDPASRPSTQGDSDKPTESGARSRVSAEGERMMFDAVAARQAMGRPVEKDDLTIVEGIGPAIQNLFHGQGIRTWVDLAQCSVSRCEEILRGGGDRFKQHNPGTWPAQAAMAVEGKWAELKAWQDKLEGGQ